MKVDSSIEATQDQDTVDDSRRRFNYAAAMFGFSMMLAFLVMPFLFARSESTVWGTLIEVATWAVFCGSWMFQGYLTERSGGGFMFVSNAGPRTYGTTKEILFFLLVYTPSAFAYLYVTYLNTSYIGFNFIVLFVVAGLATHVFPLWLCGVFILGLVGAWNLLGYVLWGSFHKIDELIQALSGFAFSIMMFQIFKMERGSRFKAVALSKELDTANEKLRMYSSQVEELSATRERNRIAREIHDTLGHSLTVVNMQLETARALVGKDAEKAAAFLEKAQSVTKQGLNEIRSSVASLRSSPLDGKSLEDALRNLLETCRSSGIEASFNRQGESRSLPTSVESALYRSAQEGLTNVRKHSKAKKVELALDYSESERVKLTLQDDGVGCENPTGGFGLMGIRERIQILQGLTEIKTSPGRGLELSISVQG